jgi:hypothetical protein
MWPTSTTTGVYPMFQVFNGENKNQGWLETFNDVSSIDAELTYQDYIVDLTGTSNRMIFNRWAYGPDRDFDTSRLRSNTVNSRAYRMAFTATTRFGASMDITLHNCLSQWRGNVSNSGGGNVTIWLHDADTNEAMYRGFVTGNGRYNVFTFNSNVRLFAQAYESGVYKGRSNTITSNELGSFD